MFTHRRPIRWGDLDPAGIVYFPRLLDICHEALESLFAPLEGGYAALTMQRRIGIPTVHITGDFRVPLGAGDTCVVNTRVTRLGITGVTFEHVLTRESDAVECARFTHVVVVRDLEKLASIAMPEDVRHVLGAHLDRD